jgi:hypothetical protein
VKASDYNLERDIFLSIPSGRIPYTNVVNKFGRNQDIDTTLEDIWDGGGVYSWPTSASITHIRAAIDSAATQGMTIEVQGLDADYNLTVQNATLDGTNSTTEVELTTPLIRCFRMKNTSSTDNDQAIQAGPTGFATINAQISIGFNQTLMALYTVPAGYTAYLTNFWAGVNKSVTSGAVDLNFWARSPGGVFRIQATLGLMAAGTSSFERHYAPYAKYSEKTDLRMSGTGSTNNFDVSAGFDLILLEN